MAKNRKVQYLTAFAVSLATMANSMAYFWTAPILPKFYNNETNIVITKDEISWVVACISPGTVTGSILSTIVSDKLGRRMSLLASAVPFIVGTSLVITATKPWVLYIARYLWGCGCGMTNTVSGIYLSEIADKEIRGTLTAATRFMFSFGALLMFTIGSFASYEFLSSLLIVLPCSYFFACWWIPESPHFLVKVGKVDRARKELLKLESSRSDNEKIVEEKLSLLRNDVRKEMLRSSSIKELLTSEHYRKAVIVTTGLRVTQVMAGSIPIQQYLGRIVQESNAGLPLSTALIIFGAVRFVVGLLSPIAVDKVGRRPLLVFSYSGACIMLAIAGTYFFFQKVIGIENESINPFRFIVFVGIIGSIIISNFGFDMLIIIIPSEIFPMNVRSKAMTVFTIFTAFLTFAVVKGYQTMEDTIGLYGVFWFYACAASIGAVFSYFVVPETRGKSLREIQIELQGNIYDDDDVEERLKKIKDSEEANEGSELKDMTNKSSVKSGA